MKMGTKCVLAATLVPVLLLAIPHGDSDDDGVAYAQPKPPGWKPPPPPPPAPAPPPPPPACGVPGQNCCPNAPNNGCGPALSCMGGKCWASVGVKAACNASSGPPCGPDLTCTGGKCLVQSGKSCYDADACADPGESCMQNICRRPYGGGGGSSRGTTKTADTGTPPTPAQPAVARKSASRSKGCNPNNQVEQSPVTGSTFTLRDTRTAQQVQQGVAAPTQTLTVSATYTPGATCWCPGKIDCGPLQGTGRTWFLRGPNGAAIGATWVNGQSTIPNVPPGTYYIDMAELAVPPGSITVTYTP